MTKEYRIEAKVKNNLLMERIEAEGFESLSSFCRHFNLPFSAVCSYATLRVSPRLKSGEWSKTAHDIADALRVMPDYIFLDKLENNSTTIKVSEAEIELTLANMVESNPLKLFEEKECKAIINQQLLKLSSKDQRILSLLYGLNGCEKLTITEISKEIGMSKQNVFIRQRDALIKLKHPSSARKLRGFYNEQ